MRGASGGAFHPLIRLAYAVEINSDWEVAESLASWFMVYQELGNINEAQVTKTLSPICFGYVAIGSMNLDKNFKITNEELPSWEDIFEIARNHSNDHVIKLVYSAFEEFKSTNSNLYQLPAAQKVRLELIK